MKHEQKFYWLDFFRGISALAVFSGHLRILCFQDIPVQKLPVSGKIFFFLTGFAHQAVIVFFVLSGFFIIKSIHESAQKNRWSFQNYATNRLTRLWVVLLPALVIGLILDKLGLLYFGDSLGYSNQIRYFTGLNVEEKLQPSVFIGNVFFLQTIFVPAFGSNGPLWSLANEFWYYFIFPFLYFTVVQRYNLVTRVIFALVVAATLIMVGDYIALYFIVWLMGGLSYILFRAKNQSLFSNRLFLAGALMLFFFILVMIRLKHVPLLFNDYFLGLVFAIIVPCLINLEMKSRLLKKVSAFFSDISYTLYCVHLPFNFFITALLYFQVKEWGASNFMIFLGLALLTLVYARLVWYLFERKTPMYKKWVGAVLGMGAVKKGK